SAVMTHRFFGLLHQDLGGDPTQVLTFSVNFPTSRFQKAIGTVDGATLVEINPQLVLNLAQIYDAIRGLPGVQSASANNHIPFTDSAPLVSLAVEGQPAASTGAEHETF